MARIAGVDLPRKKQVKIALTYIFGIGRSTAEEICIKVKVDPGMDADDLSEVDVKRIRDLINDEYKGIMDGHLDVLGCVGVLW